MAPFSLRSLLLAAIILSNYLAWTATRHHHPHNLSRHRSRHRRQGAGLYLPASYVLPGGEGTGAWGEWGEVSPCSRTCGGGVATQKRICLEVSPDGQPLCTGGDTKYFSCQTQDCPADAGDFRSQQCSEYDDIDFRGIKYKWIPYTQAPNPCELNCMPRGERFYYRQKAKVVDGTRCSDESFDVCVNGTCQPVGCDMMLGSNAREDKCRECRGNGTNCHTVTGIIDSKDLRKGYNDVLLIPQGATSIMIAEVQASNNYLALRAKQDNVYYLNGEYHIDFPRSLIIAGTLWHYERSQLGFAAPDKLRSLGPTTEPLYLSLLLQDENVGIEYEYSIPSSMAPPPNQQYNWVHEDFSPCSATCGGGFQTRKVTCRSREELEIVEDSLCDEGLKPAINQSCNTDPCPARWVEGPWSSCSKPCGEGGTRSREVYCEKIIIQGFPSMVADKECFELLGPKPELYQECNQNATCPTWFTGPWKPCDKLCGEGKQTRQVVCHQKINGKVEVFEDESCDDEKPPTEQACMLHPCDGVDWVLSDWYGCDTCTASVQTRMAHCATKDQKVVDSSFCSYHPTPVLEEPCDRSKLPPCEVLWYATQWSKCSVECGKGIQSRRVFCGLFDGASVYKVDDDRCDKNSKYNETKPCEISSEKCTAKWYAGPWSECTKECGGGEQYRRVMCLSGGVEVGTCPEESILETLQSCNTEPCDKTAVKTTVSTTEEDYDYEECEEEEDYPEVGAEELIPHIGSTIDDMMLSDSPSIDGSGMESTLISDTESEFTLESGSGSEPTTTDLWTTEGSGSTGTEFTDETTKFTSIIDTTESSTDEAESELTEEFITIKSTGILYTGTSTSEETSSVDVTTESSSTISDSSTSSSDMSSTSVPTSSKETEVTESVTTDGSIVSSTNITISETSSEETSTTSSTENTTLDEIETTNTEVSATSEGSTESIMTESPETTETSSASTETVETATTETGSTEITAESSSSSGTESTLEETGTTESTESASTESTETSISGSSETSETEPNTTVEPSTTIEPSTTVEPSTTEETSTTPESSVSSSESESSETTETMESVTIITTEEERTMSTEEATTETTELSSSASTETSMTTESVETTESGASTTAESTEKESTDSSTTEVTEISSLSTSESTESEVTETTETATTAETISSTESSSSTEFTEESSTSSGSTIESSESTTDAISTTESSSTEESTPGSTESTVEGSSTTEIAESEETETARGSTPWDWTTTVEVYTKKPRCKARKKIAKCLKSKFGCCPDKKTPAAGPFDEGCPNPKTCKESKFGCCPDGVSPAGGPKNKDCPIPPCQETLYGCCLSDNVTAAEGNEQEGCPPMPAACKSSKYGCCTDEKTEATGPEKKGCPETEPEKEETGCAYSEFGCCADNQTAAMGPNDEGCPCNTTQFGCCPDGVSTAQGSQMEGCVMTCNSSTYGCCPDGETPAHGPDNEGCCLKYAFGCCPDNYKPAEGPHLEGCGCQYAHFGCCPDNITIARGPANEGCGCQYSEFGCCPDRHTNAKGYDYEGCDCHTYQFGCCPDGETTATGPNLQGCLCQQSVYGCCGDGVTAAAGPDQFGCDCGSSKYGCCPDGKTEAKGKKFLGCTDAPESRQAACSLSTDRGPCRNYSVHWYYDMEYGGCSRFWYGGCEGNGNRFTSKEECEDVCVQPPPKDACKLPKVKGACLGYHLRWYFDTEREVCGQFVFGGCLGNANNFDSRELCQAQCEPARSEDQCNQPIERGPCAGSFGRWGFNAESRRCELFIWGGCEGNANRFNSEPACMERCNPPGKPQPECVLPQEAGNCTDKHAMWSFSQTENRCVPFYYTGCGGNKNRFDSEQSCIASCPSAYEQDMCTLPAVTGDCADYRERWYYDTSEGGCRQFYYGGCGGNDNNFATQQDCESRCAAKPDTTTTVQPTAPESYRSDFCFLELDPGPCNQMETRWGYDSSLGTCTSFEYGGCGGNRNNFPSQEYCQYYCATAQDICQLPMRAGPCDESLMRWFYDPVTDSCSQFTYGGCEGNDNRFESLEACERRCRTGGAEPTTSTTTSTTTTTTIAPVEAIPQNCQVSPILEECSGAGIVWYLDTNRHECVVHENEASGVSCRNTGVFNSQEACERSCGAFRGIEVCRYPVDPGPCRSLQPKFFFDATTSSCQQFMYGGCHGGPNRFSTYEECEQVCKPESDPCKQRPEPGNCLAYFLMWYYDEDRNECNQFVYGGCNGNDNRFDTREACEVRCRKQPIHTTTTTPITDSTTTSSSTTPTTTTVAYITTQETPVEEQCRTPESFEPCGTKATVFYYDSSRRACLAADFGNCRHPNSYRTEEECERQCGAFRGLDVCGSRLDPGPCQETGIMKVYWDAESGRCLPFAYGGCLGGPNRFSTVEECEEICAATGPESNEVEPVCERESAACAALRCAYGVQRTRTAAGCERCACVQLEVDCAPLRTECERLKCTYGLLRTTGNDGCERCRCLDHPCANKVCAEGERCVATAFRDPVLQEISYLAGCNIVNKTGSCPSVEELRPVEGSCRRECNDDADCRGAGKCCERGCSQLCLEPVTATATAATSPAPKTTAYVPELPQAPQANIETEPEVTAEEGGKATLRCLFHGNPPPKITWRHGEITIDGAADRYRLLSDGALEIVSLYRNDSGVYICIADNGLGTARQEIRLLVNDPVDSPAGIAGEPDAVVIGEMNHVLNLRCMAYGFPQPSIFWHRGLYGPMVPYSSSLYEARGNVLQIRSLDLDTLGDYACQAYNGIGKPASWSVVVKAYRPEGEKSENPYLIDRHETVLITPREPATETTTTLAPEVEVPVYTVPVTTRILEVQTTLAAGAELSLLCEVDGFPEPDVYWTKDGVPLSSSDRMQITESRLMIPSVNINDSGMYGCHARNRFSSHSSTVQINVEGLYIPPRCTDNPFFANCHLIVRGKFCKHQYYSKFCCKSCAEAGLLNPQFLEMQADESWKKKKK